MSLKFFALGLLMSVSFFATAKPQKAEVTVQTLYTCDEMDGEKWLSVGIVKSNAASGLNVLVVEHNDNDDSKNLLLDKAVTQSSVSGSVSSFDTAISQLSVSEIYKGLEGRFSLTMDRLHIIRNLRLRCLPDSTIIYERNVEVEP